ncbi:Fc.00g108500.m01.CDS01 [Cosmosporella sp. VM-42]
MAAYLNYRVESRFFNVGVGDGAVHLLVDGNNNDNVEEAVIIDGGREEACTALTAAVQATRPNNLKFRSILVTHWDDDHFGGLMAMLYRDWAGNHNFQDSTYIDVNPNQPQNTTFYCTITSLKYVHDRNPFEVRATADGTGFHLWFIDKDAQGVVLHQQQMCRAIPSCWGIGYDLFKGTHFDPAQAALPLKAARQNWPVNSLADVYHLCPVLNTGQRPIFLLVGIDDVFIDDTNWASPEDKWLKVKTARNNTSAMATVIWPTNNNHLRVSLYTGGDAEYQRERRLEEWLQEGNGANNRTVSVDCIKGGHHGAMKATWTRLLELNVQRFVVSTGGEYGHPRDRTLLQILCTRTPYWLVWDANELSGKDFNLVNVMSWEKSALGIQDEYTGLTQLPYNPQEYLAPMRTMKSYHYLWSGQAAMDRLDNQYQLAHMSSVTPYPRPPIPVNQRQRLLDSIAIYNQAINETWAVIRPKWETYGLPTVDNRWGVRWVEIVARGDNLILQHTMEGLTDVLTQNIQDSVDSWTKAADRRWQARLDAALLAANNPALNPHAMQPVNGGQNNGGLLNNGGLQFLATGALNGNQSDNGDTALDGNQPTTGGPINFMAREATSSFTIPKLVQVEETAELWTISLLSIGLDSVPQLPNSFSKVPLGKEGSSCSAWLSKSFSSDVVLAFTGTKTPGDIDLDQIEIEFTPTAGTSTSKLAFTTSRAVRVLQFGMEADNPQEQTELGYDDRFEGVLFAVDVPSCGQGMSLSQLCSMINFSLNPTTQTLLRALNLRPLPTSRSGLWFSPKFYSRTIMRVAMEPDPKNGGVAALKNFLKTGLGPLKVTDVAIIGTSVVETRGPKLLSTWAKLSVIATLTWDEGDDAPPPFKGQARVTFTDGGVEVALSYEAKDGLLEDLLKWAQSLVGGKESSPDSKVDSQAHASNVSKTLKTVTSGDKVDVRSVSISFDAAMKPIAFKLELEAAMSFSKSVKVPFLVAFTWSYGVFTLSAGIWPRSMYGTLPALLHPYYESTAIADPLTQPPSYVIPLKELLHLQDIPPGIPNTITDARMQVSYGQGQIMASFFASVACIPVDQRNSMSGEVPLLQLDKADLSLGLNYLTSGGGSPEVSALFDASITLNLPESYTPDFSPESVGRSTNLNLKFAYTKAADGGTVWAAQGRLANLTVAHIFDLFARDGSSHAILDVMAGIRIIDVGVSYEYHSGGKPGVLELEGSLQLGPPEDPASCVELDLTYNHHAEGWGFEAVLQAMKTGDNRDKPFRIANMLQGLVEDEEDLPEVIRNLTIARKDLGAQLVCTSALDDQGEKHVIFSLNITIGDFVMAVAQIRSVTAALKTAQTATTPDKVSGDNKGAGPGRLLRFTLSKIGGTQNVPVIGEVPQPFDQLGIVWTNRDITPDEFMLLNKAVFNNDPKTKSGPPLLAKEDKDEKSMLASGCHFQVALLEAGKAKLVLDHVVAGKKKEKKGDNSEADPSEGDMSNHESSSNGDSQAAPGVGDAGKSVAPMAKTFGPLSVRSIGISVEGKSFSQVCISLDASVCLGPVTFALLGFSFTIKLSGITTPEDLKRLIPRVAVQGMALSFEKPPTRLAGMFVAFEEPTEAGYMGAIAVSLEAWSGIAGGMYAQSKVDNTKSVFVFGIIRGPIVSFGCAEINGLTGGFGYNSQLKLPDVSQIPAFPFIALNNDLNGGGGNLTDNLASLRGTPEKPGWMTMMPDEMWLIGGIGLKAFQTVDAILILALKLSSEPRFTVLAQATAIFPRSLQIDPAASNPLANAFLVVDIVIKADIDPFHGTILAVGELTPRSFILSPSCHLTGGFAFAYFLKGSPHDGDFVFTVGGYHPQFTPPSYYPANVARVGINWAYDSDLRLSGEAYFAVTPQVAMGGGRLDIVLDKGWVRVNFSAYADFFMHFHPFFFLADVGIALHAEINIPLLLWTLHLGPLEFSASLSLHGPPVGGVASLHLWRWDVDVSFGPQQIQVNALSLQQLICMVKNLPVESNQKEADGVPNHFLTITKGVVTAEKKPDGTKGLATGPVEIRGTQFEFEIEARVPILTSTVGALDLKSQAATELFARPMQLETSMKASHLTVTLARDTTKQSVSLGGKAIANQVAPAIWGKYISSATDAVHEPMLPHTMGYSISVKSTEPPAENLPTIDMAEFNLIDVGTEEADKLPPVEPAQAFKDDDSFHLVENAGPQARAPMLVSKKPIKDAVMVQARRDALAAWGAFRKECESSSLVPNVIA